MNIIKCRFFCKIEKEYKITPIRDKNFRVWLEWDWSENKRIQENTIKCRFFMKLGKNIKLLQSETKILEWDWSENKSIQENADFLWN